MLTTSNKMDRFIQDVVENETKNLKLIAPAQKLLVKRLVELVENSRTRPRDVLHRKHCSALTIDSWKKIFGKGVSPEEIIDGEEIIQEMRNMHEYPMGPEKHMGWYVAEENGYDADNGYSEYCCDCNAHKEFNGEYTYTIILYWDATNWIAFMYSKTYEIDRGGDKVHFYDISDDHEIESAFENKDKTFQYMLENELYDLLECSFPTIFKRCFGDKRPRPGSDSDDEDEPDKCARTE